MGAGSFRGPAALTSASAIVTLYSSVQSSMCGLSIQSVEVELDLLLCGATCCQTSHHPSFTSPRLSAPIVALHRAFCGETRKIPETPSPRLLLSPISSPSSAAREMVCIPLPTLAVLVNTTAGFLSARAIIISHPSSSHVPLVAVLGCFRPCTQQRLVLTASQLQIPTPTAFPHVICLHNFYLCFCGVLTLDKQ